MSPVELQRVLPPGSRLGPYEVLGIVGAGGMGEVYRARDPRLGREVAIKVLPEPVAADSRRRRFFEREARAAAALNHPNILDIHDVGLHEGIHYVVFELLEGRTLRQCLQDDIRLPARKVVDVCVQIARGLAAAHEKGIIHRDLKPENLFLTDDGQAKILDFGLVRLEGSDVEAAVGSQLPTVPQDTRPGTPVGTAGYMSPEQVRGEVADHRSDIFSFGAVLYEVLSGRRAFKSPTSAETQVSILHDEVPNLTTVEASVPPALAQVVQRCLEKRPEERFQSTRDLGFALETLSLSADSIPVSWAAPPVHRPRRARWVGGAAALLLLTLGALWWWGQRRLPLPTWTPVQVTSDPGWEAEPALSPDGSLIAFASDRSGNADIWIVDARGGDPLQLTRDPADDRSPAWYPDSSAIAFVSDRGGANAIWKIPKLGGSAVLVLRDAEDPAVSHDERIAFSRADGSGQLRIAVADLDDPSQPTVLTDDEDGLWDHRNPAWSPDGRTLCYADHRDLWLVPAGGGSARRLTHEQRNDEQPMWSPDGRHIYFSSSRDGVLALWRIASDGSRAERLTSGTGPEADLSLSSDGRRLAYSSSDVNSDIVIVDLQSGEREVLGGERTEICADIAPDRSRMVFTSDRDGSYDLWIQPLESGRPQGSPSRLTDQPGNEMLPAFSPDGRWVAYGRVLGERRDVWIVASGGGPSKNFTDHPAVDLNPAWSPDGSRLAFASNRDGHSHVWVAPVADGDRAGPARPLTSGETTDWFPVWSQDASEIAFLRGDAQDWDVWIVPSDGSTMPRQLTRGASARQVRWEPGGRSLLVSGRWEDPAVSLRRVSADTGQSEPLAPPVVMGGAGALGLFDISDDGDVLVFAREAIAGDIWLLEASRHRF